LARDVGQGLDLCESAQRFKVSVFTMFAAIVSLRASRCIL